MTKKLLALALVMVTLLACVPALAYESNPEGYITGGSAAVFENNPPLFGESAIGYIPNGATVTVQTTSGDYRYVFYFLSNGGVLQGWVDRNQVRYAPSPTAQPTARPTTRPTTSPTSRPTSRPAPVPTYAPDPYNQGVVLCEAVTLRESASTSSGKITSIKNGTWLTILNEQNGWYYVSYQESARKVYTGWVFGDYILRNPWYITTSAATYAYSLPDLSAKKVGQITSGTNLLVIAEYGDFYVVNLRSASAFIYKRDIK